MSEARSPAALHRITAEAHVQRSLLAWRMIHALGAWPARLFARHGKGAARTDGPCDGLGCTA